MTISSTDNRSSTAGDGIVTAFSFPYLFLAEDDLKVILVTDSTGAEAVQTITTHYTVTGVGGAAGGTVTMVTPPASGETLVIIREEQFTQGLDLVENDPFPSDLVEQQLDTLTMLAQQLNTEVTRSFRLSDGDTTGADVTLPTPSANAYIKWNSDATALVSTTGTAGTLSWPDGTEAAPGLSPDDDSDVGFYRIGADNLGLSLGGSKVVDYSASGAAITGTLSASGVITATSGITSGGDILSDTDSTDDLGSTGVRWANLWVDDITVTTNVNIPTAASSGNHAVNKTYVDNAIVGLRNRRSVQVASTANVALASELENGDTIDGVVLVTGDLVLLKDQTATEENGIYAAVASGAASRDSEFDAYDEHPGSIIVVEEGTANADTIWVCTSDEGGTIDVTAIAWLKITPAATALNDLTDVTLTSPATNSGLIYNGSVWIDAVIPLLSLDQVWTGSQRPTLTTLTSTSNAMAIELDDSNDFSHTFTENTTLSNPTSTAIAGQSGSIYLTQHASSPKTLAFGSEYDFAGGTAPTITATNSARDRLDYVVRADGQIEITAVLALA